MKYYESEIEHPLTHEKVKVYVKQTDVRITAVSDDFDRPFIINLDYTPEEQGVVQPSFYNNQHSFISNLTS